MRKGSYPLRPGVQGFFLTCDGGRERQATNEALNLLETVCPLYSLSSPSFFLKLRKRSFKSPSFFLICMLFYWVCVLESLLVSGPDEVIFFWNGSLVRIHKLKIQSLPSIYLFFHFFFFWECFILHALVSVSKILVYSCCLDSLSSHTTVLLLFCFYALLVGFIFRCMSSTMVITLPTYFNRKCTQSVVFPYIHPW